MNKNLYTTIKLQKGEVNLYDFGSIKLHAYKTNDLIDNEVFIFERDGNAVLLESPCFFDNIRELEAYLGKMTVAGMLVAYHDAGASFLPGIPKYSTQNAVDYSQTGGGQNLVRNFEKAFGSSFDSSIHQVTNIIQEGSVSIGGIDFYIKQTTEAFDVEIPEINAVYTHMLGHDCHSIIAGAKHADAMIDQLSSYLLRGFDLILTSHYTPEDLKDVETKIAYITQLKQIAAICPDAASFQEEIRRRYPAYSGQNYLEMTASFFFHNNN